MKISPVPDKPAELTDDQLEDWGKSLFKTGVRPVIDDFLLKEAKKTRDYGNYWSASSAGYCQRKVIFERLGVPKIEQESDARKQRVFTSGHIFHEWIQKLTKEAGLSVAQELELQDEDLMIRGHIDDLVLVNEPIVVNYKAGMVVSGNFVPKQHLILYDYKTVNSRSFTWAKQNGNKMSHYHRMQLGTYMYMLRKDAGRHEFEDGQGYDGILGTAESLTEARILKISKDDLRMMEQSLMWSTELESDVLSYWNSLNDHWKKKTLPKCTCADHEGGFMAKEAYNGYFYKGNPCSIDWYNEWKNKLKEEKK